MRYRNEKHQVSDCLSVEFSSNGLAELVTPDDSTIMVKGRRFLFLSEREQKRLVQLLIDHKFCPEV